MKSITLQNKNIQPSKIVCIGRNFVAHIAELNNEIPDEMVIFNKPNSAISTQLLSMHDTQLHYEAELCFLFQQGQFTAVGFGLDLTKRDLQSKLKAQGLPWERAKAFNGSAVLSEFIAIDKIDNTLRLELRIDNELIQQGGVSLMIYKPNDILKEIQSFMDLNDGDIVMTGTPKGVGVIRSGSQFNGKVYQAMNCLIDEQWTAL